MVVDVELSGTGPAQRVKRPREQLTAVAEEVLSRAIKRAKLQQEKVGYVTTRRDNVAMALDPRVITSKALPAEARKEAKAILEEEYSKYYLVAKPTIAEEPMEQLEVQANDAVCLGQDVDMSDASSSAEESSQTAQAKESFRGAWKHWNKVMKAIDWGSEFPAFDWAAYKANEAGGSAQEQLLKLLELDMSDLFLKLLKNTKFGYLPRMALTVLGNTLASSYVERMNSAGKLILHKGRTLLNDEMLNMLVVLRMNRKFMEFMRENYPTLAIEKFEAAL